MSNDNLPSQPEAPVDTSTSVPPPRRAPSSIPMPRQPQIPTPDQQSEQRHQYQHSQLHTFSPLGTLPPKLASPAAHEPQHGAPLIPHSIPRQTPPISTGAQFAFPQHHQQRPHDLFSSPSAGPPSSPSSFSPASMSHSITPEGGYQFVAYPHSFPSNPYFPPLPANTLPQSPQPWYTEEEGGEIGSGSDLGLNMEFDLELADLKTDHELAQSEAPSPVKKASKTAQPPRPPNAWILYRSDKLKAIADGETVPGLDAIKAEITGGSSSGSGSSGEDSSGLGKGKGKSTDETPAASDQQTFDAGSMPPPLPPLPPAKAKKPKRGSKEPTEGYLSLGRGKTGRGLPQADISKMISTLWKRETEAVRTKYENMAEQKKQEHREKYPGYKFQPLRKAEKIKMREEREREKEAAKREKEFRGAAARSARRKARPRASPATTANKLLASEPGQPNPLGMSTYPNAHGANITEGIDAGMRVFWAGAPGQPYPPHPPGPSSRAGEPRLHSYPFPMPPGSLPSLKPQEHAGDRILPTESDSSGRSTTSQSRDPSRGSSAEYRMAQSSSTTLASDTSQTVPQAITQGDFAPPPSAVIALAPHQPQAADQLIQPPPHTLLSSSYPPLEQADWEGMPPLNAAYAVPSIFKPIPIPGEEGLDIGSLDDANGAEALDANSLAAMWCLLEEDKATSSGEVSGIAMGDARNVSWQVEGSQGVEYWPQLDALPTSYEQPVELSSSMAQQIAAGWEAQAAQPVQQSEYATIQLGPGSYNTVYDPAITYLDIAYSPPQGQGLAQEGPGASTSAQAGGEYQGPFLSSNLPLSPVEPWSTASMGGGTPSEPADALRAAQDNHSVSFATPTTSDQPLSAGLTPWVHPMAPPPRHVSSSAYPSTSLFADPSGLPAVTGGGWGDRAPSFSAMTAEVSHTKAQPQRELIWDDGVKKEKLFADPEDSSLWASPTTMAPLERRQGGAGGPPRGEPPRNAKSGRSVGQHFPESEQK